MRFDIGFSVVALLFLSMIAIRFFTVKHIQNAQNVFFAGYIVCGLADLLIDIVSSTLLTYLSANTVWITLASLQVFYCLQLLLPFLLYLFLFVISGTRLSKSIRWILLTTCIPFAAMLGVVLANPFTNWLFYIDGHLLYHRPPLSILMYLHAAFYLCAALAVNYFQRRFISREITRSIFCLVLFNTAAMILQWFFPNTPLTGVSMSLSVFLMYLSFQNSDAIIDALTGCFDRNALQLQLENNKNRQKSYQVIVLSIDGFHHINSAFGVDVGDMLLRRIAAFLTANVDTQNVYRVVGDRFVVLVDDKNECRQLLRTIEKRFAQPWRIYSYRFTVSTCVCTIMLENINRFKDELSALIDYSIERAKQHGPGTTLAVDADIIRDFRRYSAIERFLHFAINENLFQMSYQPIYSVRQKKFVSLEALIRLTHPMFGPISPAEFIPIAERNGMIVRISDCMLEHIGQFMETADLRGYGIQNVKVNLSAVDLMQGNLEKRIVDVLEKHHLEPGILSVEVTETAATMFNQTAFDTFDTLHRLGVNLSLDDFGSGYANLDSVLRLPFDVVKIDRSMLLGAEVSERGSIVYQNVIRIMKELNLEVVAEGAETPEQVAALETWGVDFIQGYYFSKPLSGGDLIRLLKSDKPVRSDAEYAPAPAIEPKKFLFALSEATPQIRETIAQLETVEWFRFIDLETHKLYNLVDDELIPAEGELRCYQAWGRSSPCVNCICAHMLAGATRVVKLEAMDHQVYLVYAFPYDWKGRRLVLEVASDVTASYCCTERRKGEVGFYQLKNLFSQLNQTVSLDDFTGLQSKQYFAEELSSLLTEYSKRAEKLHLAIFDINHFSAINETYGYVVGDVVLLTFANRVRTMVTQKGISATRSGEDDFLISFRDMTHEQAAAECEHLKQDLEEHVFEKGELSFHISVSYGVVTVGKETTCDNVIESAKQKLAQQKNYRQ